jgi:hypothetical protein
MGNSSLAEANRQALAQLNEQREERRRFNEEHAAEIAQDIERRSAESVPDIVYRENPDALVEPAPAEEEWLFSDAQFDALGEALGTIMRQMREEAIARERAILGRINLLEQELRALQSAPKAKRSPPRLVKDEGEDSAA